MDGIYIYVYTYTYTYTYIYINIYIYIYIYTHTFTNVCTHACVFTLLIYVALHACALESRKNVGRVSRFRGGFPLNLVVFLYTIGYSSSNEVGLIVGVESDKPP